MGWKEYLDRTQMSRSTQERNFEAAPIEAVEYGFSSKLTGRALIVTLPDCADGAWSVPRLVHVLKMAGVGETRIFVRDEHPELMEMLLTNGKRSVPKLALLDGEGKIISTWGPRPGPIQRFVEDSVGKLDTVAWKAELFKYYRSEVARRDFYKEMSTLLGSMK